MKQRDQGWALAVAEIKIPFHPALGVWPKDGTSTQVFTGGSVLKQGLEPFSQPGSDSSSQSRRELPLRQAEGVDSWVVPVTTEQGEQSIQM